jgi:hypothetical protein
MGRNKLLLHEVILLPVGLAIMVSGLIFQHIQVIGLPLVGIGGSILATVIVNWIIMRQWRGLPILQIAEAMAHNTQAIRTRQHAELTFFVDEDKSRIMVEKRHNYSLWNPNFFPLHSTITMFTDASSLMHGDLGGFKKVEGPDGMVLEGKALKKCITDEPGKHTFLKRYELKPGDQNEFEFVSFDYYRLYDRLIWTVQNLSNDFTVRLINKTNHPNQFKIKINHHREKEILSTMKKEEDCLGEKCFKFNSYILPYQSFEIMWDFSEDALR